MTASVWNPGASSQVLSNLNRISQEFTALAGQTTFVLLTPSYTPGAQNLEVFKAGEKILPSEVTEVSGGTSFVIAACAGGEKIEAVVFPSTSSVFTDLATAASASASAASASAAAAAASAELLEQFVGADIGGNLNFVNSDPSAVFRIKATGLSAISNPRLAVQNATALASTIWAVLPGAGGTSSSVIAYGAVPLPAVMDANTLQLQANQGTNAKLIAGRTGALQPYAGLSINVGGTDVATYATTGELSIGSTATVGKLNAVQTAVTTKPALYTQTPFPGLNAGDTVQMASFADVRSANGDGIKLWGVRDTTTVTPSDWTTISYEVGRSVDATHQSSLKFSASKCTLRAAGLDTLQVTSSNTLHINPAGGLGYGAGAGGTVTQTTSKITTVTLNRPCGQITMNNAALGPGASVAFLITNTLLTVNDGLSAVGAYATANPINYRVEVVSVYAGNAVLRVTNVSAGSLSEALVINFWITKGAIA